jgi:hypothetical protein
MKGLLRLVGALACAWCCGLQGALAAEDCTLKQLASLTTTTLPDGSITVPVTLAGKLQQLTLDIDDSYSSLRASYADAEGFAAKPTPRYVR